MRAIWLIAVHVKVVFIRVTIASIGTHVVLYEITICNDILYPVLVPQNCLKTVKSLQSSVQILELKYSHNVLINLENVWGINNFYLHSFVLIHKMHKLHQYFLRFFISTINSSICSIHQWQHQFVSRIENLLFQI